VSNNKRINDEMKLQLDLIEVLENEKKSLIEQMKQFRREIKLCIESNKLSTRRNVSLIKENKELRQNNDALSQEIQTIKALFEKNSTVAKASFDDRMENVIWNYRNQTESIVKKNAQLDQSRKQVKRLSVRDNIIQRFLMDAIMQTQKKMHNTNNKVNRSMHEVRFAHLNRFCRVKCL